MNAAPDPSWLVSVELNLGEPTYLHAAALFHGGDEATERWWKDLGDLLYGRPGWHCEITNATSGPAMIWSFGAVGTSLFNLAYEGRADYAVFDWETDATIRFGGVTELQDWLEANEPRHAEHTLGLRDLAGATTGWAVLKRMGFDVDVTFDTDSWIATVRKLPVTMSLGGSLEQAVSNAREAIAHAFNAPEDVAPDIQVRVHLDQPASAALL